jgi:hypothetical protein
MAVNDSTASRLIGTDERNRRIVLRRHYSRHVGFSTAMFSAAEPPRRRERRDCHAAIIVDSAPAAFRLRGAAPNGRAWRRAEFVRQQRTRACLAPSHRGGGNGGVDAADAAYRSVAPMSGHKLLESAKLQSKMLSFG